MTWYGKIVNEALTILINEVYEYMKVLMLIANQNSNSINYNSLVHVTEVRRGRKC